MTFDIATLADISAVVSLFIAIISIFVSWKTKKKVDNFQITNQSININSVRGDVNISGNTSTNHKKERGEN
jgi:hypothetical protein